MRHHVLVSLFFLLTCASPVSAHVGYVVGEENFKSQSGVDFSFLLSVFLNPFYVILMVVTAIATISAYLVLSKRTFINRWTAGVTSRAEKYTEYVPLILRLALGSALIGAGSMNEVISPILQAPPLVASLEIILGFLLLFGIFTPALLIVSITLYGYGVAQNMYLLGNIEFLIMCIVLLLFGKSGPGIDDLFLIPVHKVSKKAQEFIPLILRLGIGGSMAFLSIYEKLLNPHSSALVVQQYHLNQALPVNDAMWVFSTGIIELFVGIALILGFKTRLITTIALLVLSSSFFYFKEGVSAHVTLFAILVCIFIVGPGKNSLDFILSGKK